MLSKIFSFRTLSFLMVLGLSLFIYKYLVTTKPEAKKVKIEEKLLCKSYKGKKE